MKPPAWKMFENYIQVVLRLDSTPGSGNQWNAPGDAVDNRHPAQSRFPLLADAKYTEHGSFSVKAEFLRKWTEKAQEMGKRFVMPIRVWPRGAASADYVVIGLDDFVELLEMARRDDVVRQHP